MRRRCASSGREGCTRQGERAERGSEEFHPHLLVLDHQTTAFPLFLSSAFLPFHPLYFSLIPCRLTILPVDPSQSSSVFIPYGFHAISITHHTPTRPHTHISAMAPVKPNHIPSDVSSEKLKQTNGPGSDITAVTNGVDSIDSPYFKDLQRYVLMTSDLALRKANRDSVIGACATLSRS